MDEWVAWAQMYFTILTPESLRCQAAVRPAGSNARATLSARQPRDMSWIVAGGRSCDAAALTMPSTSQTTPAGEGSQAERAAAIDSTAVSSAAAIEGSRG